jgi:2-hydroxychromene-2-carboxylate isomerase
MTSATSRKCVEFFYDVGSPASYLAFKCLPSLAAERGAAVVWRPMLLGGVFKATGNASPMMVPAKARWMVGDLQRWAQRHGVAFNHNPHFPINTLTLMRGAAGLQMRDEALFARYNEWVFDALWQRGLNLGDAALLASGLAEIGIESEDFAVLVGDPAVKARLIATTEEAVTRGAFGAPSFFVDDCLFFGQDRLDFVAEALR